MSAVLFRYTYRPPSPCSPLSSSPSCTSLTTTANANTNNNIITLVEPPYPPAFTPTIQPSPPFPSAASSSRSSLSAPHSPLSPPEQNTPATSTPTAPHFCFGSYNTYSRSHPASHTSDVLPLLLPSQTMSYKQHTQTNAKLFAGFRHTDDAFAHTSAHDPASSSFYPTSSSTTPLAHSSSSPASSSSSTAAAAATTPLPPAGPHHHHQQILPPSAPLPIPFLPASSSSSAPDMGQLQHDCHAYALDHHQQLLQQLLQQPPTPLSLPSSPSAESSDLLVPPLLVSHHPQSTTAAFSTALYGSLLSHHLLTPSNSTETQQSAAPSLCSSPAASALPRAPLAWGALPLAYNRDSAPLSVDMDENCIPRRRRDCRYQSCYCEENVWQLLSGVASIDKTKVKKQYAVFISNENRTIPIWKQACCTKPEGYVLWDYHVILVVERDNDALVYDLDSTLPFPCPFNVYFRHALRQDFSSRPQFHRKFRVVQGVDYLLEFSSDRSHMINQDGSWLAPPPSWPAIYSPTLGSNFHSLVSMHDAKSSKKSRSLASSIGQVMDESTFYRRFTEQVQSSSYEQVVPVMRT